MIKQEMSTFLREHKKYPNMFYYKKPNGRWSKDFYSKTWAIENMRYDQDEEKTKNTLKWTGNGF